MLKMKNIDWHLTLADEKPYTATELVTINKWLQIVEQKIKEVIKEIEYIT